MFFRTKNQKNSLTQSYLQATEFCNGFNNKKSENIPNPYFCSLPTEFCNSLVTKKSENIHILNPDIQDLSHWEYKRN